MFDHVHVHIQKQDEGNASAKSSWDCLHAVLEDAYRLK